MISPQKKSLSFAGKSLRLRLHRAWLIDKDGQGYEVVGEVIDYRTDHCCIKGMGNEDFVFGPQDVGGTTVIYFCAHIKEGGYNDGEITGIIES